MGISHVSPRRTSNARWSTWPTRLSPLTRVIAAAAVVTVCTVVPTGRFGVDVGTSGTATAAVIPAKIVLGAVGDAPGLSRSIGHTLAQHTYRDFSGQVPPGRMVTAASKSTWSQVAAMQPGSPIYQDVVRWANTLKTRPGPVLFSYSHEPEIASNLSKGTATNFIQAFRRVVTVMRAQGATNVLYTWQMTGWSFRVDPANRMRADKWYPGDAYVDVVGSDEYNWFTCGEGVGRWMSLADIATPAIAFARAHGKKLAIPEFASSPSGPRTDWINAAHSWLSANKGTVLAAFYFQRPPTNPANQDCTWRLSTSAEYAAFGAMAADANFSS